MADTYDDRYSNSESSTRYMKHRIADTAPTLEGDDSSSERKSARKPTFLTSILAGGFAGVVVDFTLYPLDVIKTRHQSQEGFRASGGFGKLYKGILPVMLSSAPLSALFFSIYNSVINRIKSDNSSLDPLVYIVAASAAELVCSSIRVPLEIVKQRNQTSHEGSFIIFRRAVKKEGFLGLYRGFSSTITREIPFACIQYPLWEYMLNELIIYQNGEPLTALQTAYCGAIAGAAAGIITTPVDVIKTRIMLAEKEKIESYKPRVYQNFIKEVYSDNGLAGFFSGVVPRTLWIMLGGFIYFGAYEQAKLVLEHKWCYFMKSIGIIRDWAPRHIKGGLTKFLEAYACSEMKETPVVGGDMERDDTLLPFEQKDKDADSEPEDSTGEEE